jgi:hypothetical protein
VALIFAEFASRIPQVRTPAHLKDKMSVAERIRAMPCYSVNTVSLDFQAGHLALLQKAATVLGLAVRALGDRREIVDRSGDLVATLVQGKATCGQANVAVVNKLRVQYTPCEPSSRL